MSWPILTVILAIPIAGSLAVLAVPGNRPRLARLILIGATAVTLGLTCVLLVAFVATPPPSAAHLSGTAPGSSQTRVNGPLSFQFQERVGWVPPGSSL